MSQNKSKLLTQSKAKANKAKKQNKKTKKNPKSKSGILINYREKTQKCNIFCICLKQKLRTPLQEANIQIYHFINLVQCSATPVSKMKTVQKIETLIFSNIKKKHFTDSMY